MKRAIKIVLIILTIGLYSCHDSMEENIKRHYKSDISSIRLDTLKQDQ